MAELITSVGTVLTGLVANLATVTTAVIGNELFQIGFGIMIFGYMSSKVVKLVKKGRK